MLKKFHFLKILFDIFFPMQVDGLEGRFAHAMGYRHSSARDALQSLAAQLSSMESSVAPGATGGLQGKVESLLAAARLRAGSAGAGRSLTDMDSSVDPASLYSAYSILSEYAEALGKMQTVLRRAQRDVAVLDDLSGDR